MNVTWFFVLLLVLLILPFVPGLVEISRRQDAQALRVTRKHDVNIHYFANRFRDYINTHFARDLAGMRSQLQGKQGALEDGSHYCLLPRDASIAFERDERHAQVTNRMFIADADLSLPGAMSYLNELYANGTISGADDNVYRAMLAGMDIELGANSILLRWMHATGEVRVANGCVLYGRVSAEQRIVLASLVQFQRLNAPLILFGKPLPPAKTGPERREIDPQDLPVKVEVGAGRWLVEDDLALPDNSCVHANLVVTGRLRLGNNCEIFGSIKSHQSLHINPGCAVHGSVVSMEDIRIGSDSSLKGPLISEAQVHLAANCRIGSTDLPTTVSAEEIHIQADCVAHGTVWARFAGSVS